MTDQPWPSNDSSQKDAASDPAAQASQTPNPAPQAPENMSHPSHVTNGENGGNETDLDGAPTQPAAVPPPPPPIPPGTIRGGARGAYAPPPRYDAPGGAYPPPPQKKRSGWRTALIVVAIMMFAGFIGLLGLGWLAGQLEGGEGGGFALGDRIGEVRIEGIISQGEDKKFWLESLRTLAENDSVKGILVRIDSPGGTVGASQELHDAILEVRLHHQKPVYVSMGDVAASGGYYIASAADRIYAVRGTLTGSIGVIMSFPKAGELAEKIGVGQETIKSGRFKDAGSMLREMTDPERQAFDFLIDDAYNQFVEDILLCRAEPIETAMQNFDEWDAYQFTRPAAPDPEAFLRQAADGRVYSGSQALKLGLVDRLGGERMALLDLALTAGIEGDPRVQTMTRKPTFSEIFGARMKGMMSGLQPSLQYRMNLP